MVPNVAATSLHSTLSWRFFAAIFFDMLTVAMVVPLLPQYCRDLGMSKSSLGFIQSTYGIMQTISTPLTGFCLDKLKSSKNVLLLSLASSALSYLVLAFSVFYSYLPGFYISRVLAGAKQTPTVVTSIVAVVYSRGLPEGEQRRKATAVGLSGYSSAASSAFCVGPAIGGYLADRFGVTAVGVAATAVALGNILLMNSAVPNNTSNSGGNQNQEASPSPTHSRTTSSDGYQSSTDQPWRSSGAPTSQEAECDATIAGCTNAGSPLRQVLEVLSQSGFKKFLLVVVWLNSLVWVMLQVSMASVISEVNTIHNQLENPDRGVEGHRQDNKNGGESVSLTTVGSVMAVTSMANALAQRSLPAILQRIESYHLALAMMCTSALGYYLQAVSSQSMNGFCCGLLLSSLTAGVAETVTRSSFVCGFPTQVSGTVMSIIYFLQGVNRILTPLIWSFLVVTDFPITAPMGFSCAVAILSALVYATKVFPHLEATGGAVPKP